MKRASHACSLRALNAYELDLVAGGTTTTEDGGIFDPGGHLPEPDWPLPPSDNDPYPDGPGGPGGSSGDSHYSLPNYASQIADAIAGHQWDPARINTGDLHIASVGGYNGENVYNGLTALAQSGAVTVYANASGFFYADSDGDGMIDMGLDIDSRGVVTADVGCMGNAEVVADF